jgi:hypothetical protein
LKIIRLERNLTQSNPRETYSNDSFIINSQEVKVQTENPLNESTSDYHSLKTECCELKSQIESIEDEMKKFLKLFLFLH